MKIILPNERPVSWNQLNARKHWSYRNEEAERVHALVGSALSRMGWQPMDKSKMYKGPVEITVDVYFKNRLLDSDNICDKHYIDALKFYLFMDDSPKYVASVTTRSLQDTQNPRTEIIIYESKTIKYK